MSKDTNTVEITGRTAETVDSLTKQPAKRKVTRAPKEAKAPKPPRMKPFVDVPFSEERTVTLTEDEFRIKTHVMLAVTRERDNTVAELDAVKAEYKQKIKKKVEELTELNGQLQSQSEKRVVPLIARYFPKKGLKLVLDAVTKKKVKSEPMTKDEHRKCEALQDPLISTPASNPPAVPVNQPTKEGELALDPNRTNPQTVEGVTIEGSEPVAVQDEDDADECPV